MVKKGTIWLFSITGLCSLINGAGYLFFTGATLGILGVNAGEFGRMITRYYGACAIGWGLVLWLNRESQNRRVVGVLLWSILVTLGPSSVIGFYGATYEIFNGLGWLFVTADTILSLGAVTFLWQMREDINPKKVESKPDFGLEDQNL